jgi:hypothetical protein
MGFKTHKSYRTTLAFIKKNMKISINIITIILFFSFSLNAQENNKNRIKSFNNFLGKEKSEAMNDAIQSFDKFLEINYKNEKKNSKKIVLFLKELFPRAKFNSTKVFSTSENKAILQRWEKSGLRREIWIYMDEIEKYIPNKNNNILELYPNQKPDSIYPLNLTELLPIIEELTMINTDSIKFVKSEKIIKENINHLTTNILGDYLYGLTKFAGKYSLIQKYVETRLKANDITPLIFIPNLLEKNTDFNNPFIKRMILVEFYFEIMKEDVENNEKK